MKVLQRHEGPMLQRARTGSRLSTGTVLGVLALLLVGSIQLVHAGEPPGLPASDREAIRRVIGDQLEAFKRHDGAAAFRHAAPALQELFGTPERFMLMVSREYPPIYRPKSFLFGELELVGGEFTQQVTVVGEDGTAAAAFYLMARQTDGSWRILGCILVPVPRTEI